MQVICCLFGGTALLELRCENCVVRTTLLELPCENYAVKIVEDPRSKNLCP